MKKYLAIFFFFIIQISAFSQNEFKVFFGGGFENDTITLLGSYYSKENIIKDTIMYKDIITSDLISGLGKSLNVEYPKNTRYDLTVIINKKTFLYSTDKLCRKSELRIENYHQIDFCFLYKGGFKFY